MAIAYWELAHGRRTTPTPEEQRQLFGIWFNSDQHQAYRKAKQSAGGTLPTEAEAFDLFARRWKPVRT